MSRKRPSSTAVHPWISEADAPLYVMTYPRERSVDDVIASHAAAEAIYYRTTGPMAWVIDASSVLVATPRERQAVVAYEQRVGDMAEQRCAGVAFVIPNATVRGLFTAVRWLVPPRYPQEIVATREAALVWARRQLVLAGKGT